MVSLRRTRKISVVVCWPLFLNKRTYHSLLPLHSLYLPNVQTVLMMLLKKNNEGEKEEKEEKKKKKETNLVVAINNTEHKQ